MSDLPDAERFAFLLDEVEQKYSRADSDYGYTLAIQGPNTAPADGIWDQTTRYAEELLALTAVFRRDADFGTGLFKSHVTLGLVAMRKDNRDAAVHHLFQASRAPTSEEIAYRPPINWSRLCRALLESGESAAVIDFLERFAETNVSRRDYIIEWAEQIRGSSQGSGSTSVQMPVIPLKE